MIRVPAWAIEMREKRACAKNRAAVSESGQLRANLSPGPPGGQGKRGNGRVTRGKVARLDVRQEARG